MNNLSDFAFREEYKRYAKLGDRLAEVDPLIDWDAFRPIVADMFDNTSIKGGRPNIDEVIMIKMLVLQAWHGLSDPELERQVMDRISFRRFLGFPDTVPDCTTVWFFRERLVRTGNDKDIWNELDRQLDDRGLKVRKGVVQDATFITSDPGHASLAKPRGEGAPDGGPRRAEEPEDRPAEGAGGAPVRGHQARVRVRARAGDDRGKGGGQDDVRVLRI